MLALPLLTAAVLSQGLVGRFGPPPDLAIGQKIRLRVVESAPPPRPLFFPNPFPPPRFRPVTMVGSVISYEPLERIIVLRYGAILGIGGKTERAIDWTDVLGIDVPQRRNGLNAVHGALAGAGVALGWGLMAGMFDSFVCSRGARCDRNAWERTKQVAPYAIPTGAVIGFFSTRWKRVY